MVMDDRWKLWKQLPEAVRDSCREWQYRYEMYGEESVETIIAIHPEHADNIVQWLDFYKERNSGPRRQVKNAGSHLPTGANDRDETEHFKAPEVLWQDGQRPIPGYDLIEPLGEGGFGMVWRAAGEGMEVALKFIPLGELEGKVELRALSTIKGISHAHLLVLMGFQKNFGHLIIKSELADATLADVFKEYRKQKERGIPAELLLKYVKEAAEGLDALRDHHIQHRDVKPENLFLVGGCVKVGDIGLARKVTGEKTGHSQLGWTDWYAPPELENGETSINFDQYCLAVAYIYLSTGQYPFAGSNRDEIRHGHRFRKPDLSMLTEAERLVLARALAKESDDRFENCTAFVTELETALRVGSDCRGKQDTHWENVRNTAQRNLHDYLDSISGKERKYDKETYVEREAIRNAIEDRFLPDTKAGMVLVGESGMGKTTFIAHLARYLSDEGHLVVVIPAVTCTQEIVSLDEYMCRVLGQDDLGRPYLTLLSECARPARKNIFIIIDGLNEYEAAEIDKLWKEIDKNVQSYKKEAGVIKFLVTCRPQVWERLVPRDRGLDSHFYVLDKGEPFQMLRHEREETLYEKYRKRFNLQPAWNALSEEVKAKVSDPQYMRILAEVFEEGTIPPDERLPWHRVMEKHVRKRIYDWENNKGDYDKYQCLMSVIRLMFHLNRLRLDHADLREAGIDTSMVEKLVSDGLLEELGSESDRGRAIRLKVERMFEYLGGRHVYHELFINANNKMDTERLADLAKKHSVLVPFQGALATALILHWENRKANGIFLDLAEKVDGPLYPVVSLALIQLFAIDQEMAGGLFLSMYERLRNCNKIT